MNTFSALSILLFFVHGAHGYAPLMEDNVAILDVPGRSDVNPIYWVDSYSVDGSCYCDTSFDHDIDVIMVKTPLGMLSIKQVCEILGKGPGKEGRPLYNDIQCGNGPANNAGDEDTCPGRTEYGREGCKYVGPKWNFTPFLNTTTTTKAPIVKQTRAPTKAPTSAPRTKAPLKPPTKAPVVVTTRAPVVPVVAVKSPTKAPAKAPVISTQTCNIVQLDLWDGASDKLVSTTMVDGMTICSSLEMAVDAITDKCVRNVRFFLNGPMDYISSRTENFPPFFLYGNIGAAVNGQKLSTIGTYTLQAIPNGRTDLTRTIMFNVITC